MNKTQISNQLSNTAKTEPLVSQSEDIDHAITNAKLRAESGSKAKHSFSLSANYNGGTMEDPLGKNRPNLNSAAATETISTATGTLNYRYRLNANDSFTAGLGLKWLTPGYELDRKTKETSSQQEAANPTIGYTRAFKVETVQNIISLTFVKVTSSTVIDREKTNSYLYFYHTAIVPVGRGGWQLGFTDYFDYYNYYSYQPEKSGKDTTQIEYDLGVSFIAEYAFNDRYNFRTLYRGNGYFANRDNRAVLTQMEPTQSMGLGMAVTRDIFLYPNVQWVWRDPRVEKTNVALSATINM